MRRGLRARRRRGATIVEFAMLSTFLFTIIFGIVEMAVIFQRQLSLMNGARQACRKGIAGKSVSEMKDTIRQVTGLNVTDAQIVVDKNSQPDASGSWTTVTDDPIGSDYRVDLVSNTAVRGEPLRVRITDWPHQLMIASLFSRRVASSGTLPLDAACTLQRE